ncbi:MAG: LuxR C-terminal-related transcriptional regulator [Pseudomonadota bacterium]
MYIGIYRSTGDPWFSEQECRTVKDGLRGLKWFHRGQLLSRGIFLSETPLTPTERDVLTALLTGASEKEIANSMGHSAYTTHDYVKSIYRKFAVSNRSALMALWLGPARASFADKKALC